MSNATKLALGAFGVLLVGGIVVSSLTPPMPIKQMPPAVQNVTSPMPQDVQPQHEKNPDERMHISSLPVLADHMPEFLGIAKWWNTADGQPLTPEKLKGKVVLVDFWTYSCINCIRTYPFVKAMHAKYADKGLVIVGVHTPEFAFEAEPDNVGREITKNGILYPVALDPDYKTWNNYNNQYWPAEYFFDRQGRLRHTHFGEGEYDESEGYIRDLLAEGDGLDLGNMANVPSPDLSDIRTPETYFGLARGDAFMGDAGPEGQPIDLTVADKVSSNRWTAGGRWTFQKEYIENQTKQAVFRFNVQADMLHLVMESADGQDKQVEIYVDGEKMGSLKVNVSTLYNIASFAGGGRHTVELRFQDAGVRLFAATFS